MEELNQHKKPRTGEQRLRSKSESNRENSSLVCLDRSDRSLQASSRFRLVLLPRCDLSLLLRDSLSIAILADLGSSACGDFGT